jgi:hypothetical protein
MIQRAHQSRRRLQSSSRVPRILFPEALLHSLLSTSHTTSPRAYHKMSFRDQQRGLALS